MPKQDGSLSAVVVSGGKQYRVAPGDRILVDRLAAEPGSSIKLGMLLFVDGSDIKVGTPAIDGLDVEAKVLAHRRGPRIETLRYKSKKRVRVHRGGRADLTAIEILAVGGMTGRAEAETEVPAKTKGKPKRAAAKTQGTLEMKEEAKAEATTEATTASEAAKADAPAKRTARKPKPAKESD